jgi:DNA-binding MarR family transcriptional regulator
MKTRSPASLQEPLLRLTGYVLRRASTASLAELNQRLAPMDLRPVDVTLLLLLDAVPQVTHSEAAETLGLRRPNLVPIVSGLEKRGLLERKRIDFRSEGLVLTAKGRSLLARAKKVIAHHEERLIERVPEKLRPMVLPILIALWGSQVDFPAREDPAAPACQSDDYNI